MPTFETPEAFEQALDRAAAAIFPGKQVVRISRSIVATKFRIDLDARRFIDVFFNCRNQRTDLTVIEGDRRIFGCDNLGGWHRHPAEAPDRHEACEEPTLESFLRECAKFIAR